MSAKTSSRKLQIPHLALECGLSTGRKKQTTMKRGFLVNTSNSSQQKKNNNPPTTTPAPKAAGGSVRGEFFSKVPPRSAAPPRKLPLDKTIEYESLREDINMEKQTVRLLFFCRSFFFRCTLVGAPTTLCVSSGPPQLHNYEQREEHTKAALASLLDHTGEEESKVWYCAGDFFIRLPMDKAKGLAQQGMCSSGNQRRRRPLFVA